MASLLEVKDLHLKYAKANLQVLAGISFSLEESSFTSIVGPSGCGKSTLLRCISGLRRPTSGEVVLSGNRVTSPVEGVSLVFQEYNRLLLPWRSVLRNVILPVEDKLPKSEAERRASDLLKEVGLTGFEKYFPWQLSGGMQQRVAIARALSSDPKILLMDEPFASVDAQTRMTLEDQLLRLWKERGLTVLFVTHDIDESVYLSQRIIVLGKRPSRIIEDVVVRLPYPRDQVSTRNTSDFAGYRTGVFEKIRGMF